MTMRLTLHTFLTLDGVMQAPGGPDEDPDGHFEHGGWSFPHGDQDFGPAMAGWFAQADAFLLGRETYKIFRGHWPRVTDPGDPIASKLNTLPKYVAPTTLGSADWHNSSVLGGVAAEVARLKQRLGNELQVTAAAGSRSRSSTTTSSANTGRCSSRAPRLEEEALPRRREGGSPAAHRQHDDKHRRRHRHLQPAGPVRHGSYALEEP
jgi:dihydrofolate reductase